MRGLILLAAVALGLAGCGVSFDGSYKGPITSSITSCSNGAAPTSGTTTITMQLSEPTGNEVDIDAPKCPGIHGAPNGNVVAIQQQTCLSTTDSSGMTTTVTFTGGTLTLNGSNLAVAFTDSVENDLSSGATVTCLGNLNGTLALQ